MAISVACRINAPINIKQAGGGGRQGGRAWGVDLIVLFGPGVGHLTDLVLSVDI